MSADAYRTTIETLRKHGGSEEEIEFYDKLAQDAQNREDYAQALGKLGTRGLGESAMAAGTKIMIKILEDGWIPPEGLF